MAHVIDNSALKLIANVLVDSRPREAKFTPDGKQVWVSSEVGGSVSVIDVASWKLIKKIRFDVQGVRPQLLQPVGMEFTKDGKYLFVALGPANRVHSVNPRGAAGDTATKRVTPAIRERDPCVAAGYLLSMSLTVDSSRPSPDRRRSPS